MPQIKLNKVINVDNNIKLVKLSNKFISQLLNYSNNSDFFRFMEYRVFTKEQNRKYFLKKCKENNFDNNFFYVLLYDRILIGTFFLSSTSNFAKNYDISYGINPNFWGKGIFSKTLKKFLKVLKNKKINRIQAITRKDNKASINGLKKNGFVLEGQLSKYYFDLKTKSFYDALILAIVF